MESTQLKAVLEALLFMSTEPMEAGELRDIVAKASKQEKEQGEGEGEGEEADVLAQLQNRQESLKQEISLMEVKEALKAIMADYQNTERGIELVEVAKGYQFRTKAPLASYITHLFEAPKTRLSTPGMETLAIVAYQQPVARARIEEIRGVDSGGVLKTLLDRDLVRIVGRSEEPGRPILYGTTSAFLELFGLNSLADLPTLKDLEALGTQAPYHALEEPVEPAQPEEDLSIMDEESSALVSELENSMRSLKDLEKDIFPDKPDSEDQKP